MKKNTKVSGKAAALIIGGSAILPLFCFWLFFGPAAIAGSSPVVESLGGFNQNGNLQGLTLRVNSRAYVCGGPEGHVLCEPAPKPKKR